jgi:signal transduction histidine kinase/CheY-like chemotaxis protein
MKKYYLYVFLVYLTLLVVILFSFWKIFIHQNAYQREILQNQVQNCGSEIENNVVRFASEVNYLLFSEDLIGIIGSDQMKPGPINKIEMLYSSYKELVRNVYIYDQEKNVVNLFYDKKNSLIIDPYSAQRQKALADKELVQKSSEGYQYSLPIFKDKQLAGNIVLTLDFARYINSIAKKYRLTSATWQWVTDENGKALSTLTKRMISFSSAEKIQSDLKMGLSGSFQHTILINNKRTKVISSYYPMDLLTKRLGIVFSLDPAIHSVYLIKIFIITLFCVIVLLITSLLMLRIMHKKFKDEKTVNQNYSDLKSIIDALPLGIMVMDGNNNIKMINPTAREMLMLKADVDIKGKNLLDRFILSKDYIEDDSIGAAFDSNQFILYKNEGEEAIVYKKEISQMIHDEELILSAFVDITGIEKARKYETASNTAKSEFLAKMSHEIRTPMNGIIGMTEALHQENLTKEQKEYVEIVRKSADLLLNLIDDILDFSKIEAGKMQLEEIPFKLRDEVKTSLDLFRPIVEEKNLKLSLKINQDVPQNIIGDPFRLRQVLSNLISNAVKFTHEGEIVVGVELEDEYNGNLTLQFYVEDTGVGIPNQKIESIFNSFTQAEESTSRKYGGSGLGTTISKQLVTLMNGEIWVQSPATISTNPKYPGSKFSFTIEVFSNEKLIKNIKTDHITNLNQLNALVISQNIDIKRRLYRFFESQNISFDIFDFKQKGSSELIALLKDNIKPYRLLFILDETGLPGLDLAKRLRDTKYIDSFIVFMLSSNHKSENYIQSKRYSIDYYLTEPFEYNDLLDYIYESFGNIKQPREEEATKKIKSDIAVLVAEDNIINQKVALTIFGNLGLQIDIAQNGQEVIEKVKKKDYDIIFMDLMMPELDGIQTTVEIRGLGYQIPIVAMTATASSKTKSKALSSGMNDYITKPFKTDTLKKILFKWFT